jgi:hypothetical protein
MKKIGLFFGLLVCACLGYGLNHFFPYFVKKERAFENSSILSNIQKHLQTFYPVLDDQSIVVIVLSHNDAEHCKKNLCSLFSQTYSNCCLIFVDNGSQDGTFDKAKAFADEQERKIPIKWIQYQERQPEMKILYEVIHACDPQDVVAVLKGNTWLAHENVLDHLNCAYANPDVWMTYSRAVNHPDYQQVIGDLLPDSYFLEKKFRRESIPFLASLKSFYAGFFKEIKLEDFLFRRTFIDEKSELAIFLPLVEMGPEHILFMNEITLVQGENRLPSFHKSYLQRVMEEEAYIRCRPSYLSIGSLQRQKQQAILHRIAGDILLFSEDSPLHLYACLESLYSKVLDRGEISVIYTASTKGFERAYLNLKTEFPEVQFFDVCDYPGNDFATLLTNVVKNKRHASPFLFMADDQMVFEGKIPLHECIQAMEKVHVDHFFLHFDEEEGELTQKLPEAIMIGEGIYGWQVGERGVSLPHFASICRKKAIEMWLDMHPASELSSLKHLLKNQLSPESVVLFFEEKKLLSLGHTREASEMQRREWGDKFIQGFKVDLSSLLYEGEEFERGDYPLVKREKKSHSRSR